MPDQREVGRAKDLNELEEQLQTIPADSLMYHAQRNHFSHWLMARTEFALAAKLRPRKVSDFDGPEHLRRDLIESINDYRREQNEVLIGDFKADTFKPAQSSFPAHRLRFAGRQGARPGLRPSSAAHAPYCETLSRSAHLGASRGRDRDRHVRPVSRREQSAATSPCTATTTAKFSSAFWIRSLPVPLQENLKAFLEEVRYPLAVRSSSLLEDSQYQPFTGVYETFMLGNQQAELAGAARRTLRGDQARLRVDLQPACQSLRARHAVPPGRREDGGDPAAGGGHAAWPALLSGFLRRGALAQFLSRRADDVLRTESPRSRWAWDAPWSMEGSASASVRAIRGTCCSSRRSKTFWPTRRRNSARSNSMAVRMTQARAICAKCASASMSPKPTARCTRWARPTPPTIMPSTTDSAVRERAW